LTPREAEARKTADAVRIESLKLRNQLHEATQETRVGFQQVSALRKKLLTAQKEVTSQRASMGRKRMEIQELEAACVKKREEFRELEVKELTWSQRVNTTTFELNELEEAYAEKTCMGWDLMTRLTSHMSGATMFGAIDIRARQERKVEEKLAMELARSAADLVAESHTSLEEDRKVKVREAIELEKIVKAQEKKSKMEAVAREKAEKERNAQQTRLAEKERKAQVARQAELDRKAVADRKAEAESRSWREPDPQVPARTKTSWNWPRLVALRLVKRDDIPANNVGYR
jgi:colicin import membrane protein